MRGLILAIVLIVAFFVSPANGQVTAPCSTGAYAAAGTGYCSGTGIPVFPVAALTSRTVLNPAISSNAMGFSYEKSVLDDQGLLVASNAAMVELFKNLGSSCIVRIGGGSTEAVSGTPMLYNASGTGMTAYQISPPDITRFNGFLNATGCKAIYAIAAITPQNASQTTALMTAEASQVISTLGSNLYAFELGNEIDQSGLSSSAAVTALQQVITAIQAASASAPIECPDVSFFPGTAPSAIVSGVGASCSLLTAHYYIGNGTASPAPTIAQMLSGDPSSSFSSLYSAIVSQNTLGARMDEGGTFYNSGTPGVSNSAASALEVLSFEMKAQVNGLTGFNFHGGATSYYAPINDSALTTAPPNVLSVNGTYYAMLAYDLMAGGTLTTKNWSSNPLFETYYVSTPGGGGWLVLNNKSAYPINLSYNVGATINSAFAYTYAAPSPASTSGETLAGSAVSVAGAWSPSPAPLSFTGSVVPVPAAPYTFTLARIQ